MFRFSEKTKEKMYAMFGRNEEMVEDDVNIIKTWLQTQRHLPEIMDDIKIRNFLNMNKYSIEKTKQKIDMYYTIRSVIPDLFERSNPKLENNQKMLHFVYVSTLPIQLEDVHRVHYVKPKEPNILSPIDLSHAWFALFEIRLYEDFIVDDIIVFDLAHVSVGDLKKTTPTLLSKFFAVYKKVYSLRLNKLIYINCPTYVTIFSTILRSVLSAKIFDRVQFHENENVLKEIFPKEFIPKDYGGQASSLEELSEKFRSKLAEYTDRFDQLDKLRVDESLRPEKLNNDEILGFYGSFKKIDVD